MAGGGKKRGEHPRDDSSFDPGQWPALLSAVRDLSWLKSRGYADASSLKLVGDRYALNARQRTAVSRSACGDDERSSRSRRRADPGEMEGKDIHIDGFNLLTTVEAALGGGVLLVGRDGCLRDMSSMHGNYRLLGDTDEAVDLVHDFFRGWNVRSIRWYLDQPVSNSGRLRSKILDLSRRIEEFEVEVILVPDPDPVLCGLDGESDVVVTADSGILDSCGAWCNAARVLVAQIRVTGKFVDLSGEKSVD